MRLLTALIAVLAFLSSPLDAKVIETNHIEDILPFVDEETWLLIDLDNCMFEACQALGSAHWFYDCLQQRMGEGMTRDEAIRHFYPEWIKTQKICRVQPLEKTFVPTLLMLQKRGVVIMGLTHRQPLVADSTLRQIASLGFDFSLTAPSKKSFEVLSSTPTLYTQGVLFVGDYNKKIAIFTPFLERINQRPKKIVFVDDKRKNVDELDALSAEGVEYLGVHYTAIDHVPPLYNREVAAFQARYLDQILSNEAALLLMERGL